MIHQEDWDAGHCHIDLVIIEERMFSEVVWIPKTFRHLQLEDVLFIVPEIWREKKLEEREREDGARVGGP